MEMSDVRFHPSPTATLGYLDCSAKLAGEVEYILETLSQYHRLVMDQQSHCFKHPEMHLQPGADDQDPPAATLLITVDRAPSQERPFAAIPNPYDNACSVLCNHPYGHRFSWFTRRFVSLSRMVSRRTSLVSEKSATTVPGKSQGAEQLSQSQHLSRIGTSEPSSTEQSHNVAFHLVARKHRVTAGPVRNGENDRPTSSSTKTGLILSAVGESSDEMHDGHGTKTTWLQDGPPTDGPPFGHNQILPLKNLSDEQKVQQQSSPNRQKKKKKTSKMKRSRKKDSSLNADGVEETDDLQMTDTAVLSMRKGRKGKRTGRRVVPASREEVENPLTLVEDDEQGSGVQGRGGQIVEMVMDPRFSTLTDGASWNEAIRETLQKQLDEELEGSTYDPKRLQDLQNMLQASMAEKSRAQVNKELQDINEEMSKKTLRNDHWMHHPRIPNMRCCRFELPMDARALTLLDPAEYLSTYCVVPRKRRQLFFKVFTKYRGTENHLTFQNLPKALKDIFGEPIEAQVLETIYSFTQIGSESVIELPIFIGLAALTERFLCQKMYADNRTTSC